jgi:phenylacetate-CoA ligase
MMLRYLKQAAKSAVSMIPSQWIMDSEFRRLYRWLQQTQWLPLEELQQIQRQKLLALMCHVYEKVPYYREIMKQRQLKPSDFDRLESLKLLPPLSKQDVKVHSQELLATDWQKWKPMKARSGGTTGNPLEIWVGRRAWNMEWAQHWRFFHWAGYRFNDLCLVIRPMPLATNEDIWYFNARTKQVVYIGGSLSIDRMAAIFDKMRESKAPILLTYPSVLRSLSRFALANDVKVPKFRAIITSSETFLREDRCLAQQVFDSPIFDWYGQGEHVTMAAQCQHGNYHLGMEYSITETNCDGSAGCLIGTCLDNYAMPMIRYQTDDLVSEICTAPCGCGRQLAYLRWVEGKHGDVVITPSGAHIIPSVLYQCVFDLPQIGGVQFIQEDVDYVRVLVVPAANYTEHEHALLRKRLEAVFAGENMHVDIEPVDAIEPTGRGKHPLVIRKVVQEQDRSL